jgi:mannose-1-phosphate guanylyltransferase
LVVQPANKDTAPPILHSLLSIAQLDAQALVAILPCDHHYSDEESFARRWSALLRLRQNGRTPLFCWARSQIIRKSSTDG